MEHRPWFAFVLQECVLGPRAWTCRASGGAARLAWSRRHGVSLPPSDLLRHLVAARVAVAREGGLVGGVGLLGQWRYEVTHPEFARRLELCAASTT